LNNIFRKNQLLFKILNKDNMSAQLYLIYSLFNENCELTQNEIIVFCKPYLLFFNENYINTEDYDKVANNYFIDIINLLFVIDGYVKKKILIFDNNKYSINYENNEYIKYKKYMDEIDKKITKMIDKVSLLNDKYDSTFIEDIQSDSESESSKLLDTNKEEQKYYICESFCEDNKYYLVDYIVTKCNCKSFEYCKKDIKTCKHLKYCTQNFDSLITVDLDINKCTCNYDGNKQCEHLDYAWKTLSEK
jgi:hypothetical protein